MGHRTNSLVTVFIQVIGCDQILSPLYSFPQRLIRERLELGLLMGGLAHKLLSSPSLQLLVLVPLLSYLSASPPCTRPRLSLPLKVLAPHLTLIFVSLSKGLGLSLLPLLSLPYSPLFTPLFVCIPSLTCPLSLILLDEWLR